jgi:predicted peptidase
MRALPLVAALVLAAPLAAQANLTAAPSTRATTTLTLSPPRVQGQPAPAAKTVVIDYGQPHARGRDVPTELSKDTTIWRTGANTSTTMTSQADLTIGGAAVPAGSYSLYTVRENGKYVLIINRNTGQWGTEYDKSKDLVRVPLTARTLHETQESLQIAFVPATGAPAKGTFTIAWGKLHLSTEWSVR